MQSEIDEKEKRILIVTRGMSKQSAQENYNKGSNHILKNKNSSKEKYNSAKKTDHLHIRECTSHNEIKNVL